MMETRPKIKLSLTQLDKTLELISVVFLIVMVSLTVYVYLKLPDTIPIHYSASGKPDSYGSKTTLLILAGVAIAFYAGLTWLNKYPHIFNYMTKITEENASRQYSISTRMIRITRLSVLIIFTVIILFTYLTTIHVINGLGSWFLPFCYAILLIPTIISVSRSLQKNNRAI